jgi:hypothetical protein
LLCALNVLDVGNIKVEKGLYLPVCHSLARKTKGSAIMGSISLRETGKTHLPCPFTGTKRGTSCWALQLRWEEQMRNNLGYERWGASRQRECPIHKSWPEQWSWRNGDFPSVPEVNRFMVRIWGSRKQICPGNLATWRQKSILIMVYVFFKVHHHVRPKSKIFKIHNPVLFNRNILSSSFLCLSSKQSSLTTH